MFIPPDDAANDASELFGRQVEQIVLSRLWIFDPDRAVIARLRFIGDSNADLASGGRAEMNVGMADQFVPEFGRIDMKHDLPLFSESVAATKQTDKTNPAIALLEGINPDDLTSCEALDVLYKLKA